MRLAGDDRFATDARFSRALLPRAAQAVMGARATGQTGIGPARRAPSRPDNRRGRLKFGRVSISPAGSTQVGAGFGRLRRGPGRALGVGFGRYLKLAPARRLQQRLQLAVELLPLGSRRGRRGRRGRREGSRNSCGLKLAARRAFGSSDTNTSGQPDTTNTEAGRTTLSESRHTLGPAHHRADPRARVRQDSRGHP